jgi:hypothetical protein
MNKTIQKTWLGIALLLVINSLLVSCGSSRRSIAVEEGWELLSEQKVNFVRDKDEIKVNAQHPYSALRFKVESHDIHLSDVIVYFNNGDKLEPNIDEEIKAGQTSREIELGSEGRFVDRIEFKYRTEGSLLKGRANVLVFARKNYPGY